MKKLEEMEIREDMLMKIIKIGKQIDDLPLKETDRLKKLIRDRAILESQYNDISDKHL